MFCYGRSESVKMRRYFFSGTKLVQYDFQHGTQLVRFALLRETRLVYDLNLGPNLYAPQWSLRDQHALRVYGTRPLSRHERWHETFAPSGFYATFFSWFSSQRIVRGVTLWHYVFIKLCFRFNCTLYVRICLYKRYDKIIQTVLFSIT